MEEESGFELTGFGDEISPELTEQLEVLIGDGIRHLELRGIWNRNVLDLDGQEVKRARSLLAEYGVRVSAIASPVGKVPVGTEFSEYLPTFERAIQAAKAFDAGYIRIFSFYIPLGDADHYREEVIRRLSQMAERAERAGVVLLHENERDIYGETPERCLEIVRGVDSPALRVAFDPANFVQAGIRPFVDAYPLLADYIEYVHIKDALFSDGSTCLPGHGDGEIRDLLSALRAKGYRGFLSLEPHLVVAGRSSGFSGPEPFRSAIGALREILASL